MKTRGGVNKGFINKGCGGVSKGCINTEEVGLVQSQLAFPFSRNAGDGKAHT